MSKFSVKKPITVFVVVVVMIALGIVSTLNMTPDLLPSMDLPYVVVMTTYPGATPEEVEETVTKPLEQSLSTLENLERVQSISNANYSMIMLEFETDADMDTAVVNTLQSVDLVEGSWEDTIGSPYIMKLNPNMMPIAVAAVDMEGGDTEELSTFVEETLMSQLEGTTGVASINTGGLIESKINVVINEDKIEKLNKKLLDSASPDLADAKAQLSQGMAQLRKAEAKLAESRAELDATKEDTYDQLAEASANLDAAVAQASALSTQIKTLEGQKMALEAQIQQGAYGPELGISLEDLQGQLAEVTGQLAMLQMDSEAADKQVNELKEAYKQAERGSYTAMDSFTEGYNKLDAAQSQIASQRAQLNDAQAQLDEAGNQALNAAGLSEMIDMDMVSGVLQGQNFSMPAGYVQDDTGRYLVSVGDKLNEMDDVENLFLFDIEGLGKVYLKDVADIFISDNSDAVYASIDGNPGVLLSFFKQSNYATATVSDNLQEKFDEISVEYEDITFTTLMDQGDYIYLIIGSILSSLGWGALFAVVILFLFLRDLKPTIITLLSIPISIVVALVLMYFSGVTLNMISLSGLAVAVGMLVDNGIVVIENIFRLRRLGVSPAKAAVAGAKQVAAAITASTLTTVCVFAPIIFVEGITRQLFTDMALTITYALLASLIIALTLVPAMASVMLRKEPKPEGRGFQAFQRGYRKAAAWSLRHRFIVLGLAVVLLVFSVVASVEKGFIFMPDMATPQLSGNLLMEDEEADVEDTRQVTDKALKLIQQVDGVATAGAMLGSSGPMGAVSGEVDATSVSLYVIMDENTDRSGGEIGEEIEKVCENLPATVEIMTASSMSSYTSALGGDGVGIEVYSTDNDVLQREAKKIGELLETVEGIDTVDNGLTEAEPEIHFAIDKQKAMKKGLTVAQVYMQVSQALTTENTATSIRMENEEYDVVVVGKDTTDLTPKYIKNLKLTGTKDGEEVTVKLKDIARIQETESLPSISRLDQKTYLTVNGLVKEGYNVTLVTEAAKEKLKEYTPPEGVTFKFNGENEMIMDAMGDLLLMMALGVLLVYLIMVAQFQSFRSPFIVMFTIPLAFTGGLLILLIFGKEISIIAMIGLIMLVGIIVNNGIVLVDYINQLRAKGMKKRDAILEAGATRMRPVLMTSLTTILGLIVMAVGKTAGTDMMQPIALVCIGGLVYATALTLFIVPIMYDLFNGEKYKMVKEEDVDIRDLVVE
ncbi:MAG: MMPL family transporter [Firmicutes bacterium]|nr:MMPL family transporter [Bacillota bacterium]